MKLPFHLALALLPVAAAGCASSANPFSAEVAELAARHQLEWELFEAQKAALAASLDLTEPLDYGRDGKLFVGEVELRGRPWNAYLRAEFYFVNSGEPTRGTPQVTLAVADPATGESIAVTQDLILPFGIVLTSDSTYRSWIEVPTDGLHEREGWTWDIYVEPRER